MSKKLTIKEQCLKNFMRDNFPFAEFKQAGIFAGLKFNDYEGQAKRICNRLGIENIYDYGRKQIRAHLSDADPKCKLGMDSASSLSVNEKGQLKSRPFVETFFRNSLGA